MPRHPLIVVGGGPAGLTAARAYLDAGGDGPVTVLSADIDPPYERPPLSKDVLRNVAQAPSTPPILDETALDGIDVRLGARVSAVDTLERTLAVSGSPMAYDRLVLAPGAAPTPLPVADGAARVHYLRSLADARELWQAAAHARSAVVIGSGFIGCEAAASLAIRGLNTTLVTPETGPQADRLGEHAAGVIAAWLTELGVELRTRVEVTAIEQPCVVHTSDGRTHDPDLVLAATGITPATDFLLGSGVQLHNGRIVTDEHLRTSTEGVWAAGDAVRAHHPRAGRPLSVEHWGDALTMGQVAGRGAAGMESLWGEPPGFWSDIGGRQLKYTAWGDGWDESSVTLRTGGFTVRYGQDGLLAGVLTHNADDDYERGTEQLGRAPFHPTAPGADQ